MLPERQKRGFMLVRDAQSVFDDYEKTEVSQDKAEYLARIRNAVSFVNPAKYRGVARGAVEPWSSTDEKLLQRGGSALMDLRVNEKARRRFLEVNGEDRDQWDYYGEGWDYNKALVADLRIMKELRAYLDAPDEYEIIEVARDACETDWELFGFDVGYWRSGNFSLICDSIVMPRWHPPLEDDLPGLAELLRSLNEHVLFSTVKDAQKFRDYYRTRDWAESEDLVGEFCIIQVSLPEP